VLQCCDKRKGRRRADALLLDNDCTIINYKLVTVPPVTGSPEEPEKSPRCASGASPCNARSVHSHFVETKFEICWSPNPQEHPIPIGG